MGSNSLTVSSGGSGTVTRVATGTGLTGGTITTSGTISISSTYRTYISNGNTAYGWGNHANAGYLQSGYDNLLLSHGNEFNFAYGWVGGTGIYVNYRGVSNIFDYYFFNGNGGYSNIYANSCISASDIRKKNIIDYNYELSFEAVAFAPSIKFTWNEKSHITDTTSQHIGSIAQYWQSILPEAVHQGPDGYLSMQYDVIALLSAISVAKRVTEHERRIEALERENAMLRLELNKLKENIQ